MHHAIEKNARRAALREARASMNATDRKVADEGIMLQVINSPEYANAHVVFCYVSFGEEIDTRAIISQAWKDGKTVAAPRCTGKRNMEWHRITSFEELELSRFGVEEPLADSKTLVIPEEMQNAIALVPGLEFDSSGYRLGYGGGFYDTFLQTFLGTPIGLCRDEFFNNEEVIREPHDLPAQLVMTQSRTIYCR